MFRLPKSLLGTPVVENSDLPSTEVKVIPMKRLMIIGRKAYERNREALKRLADL